LRGRSFGSGPLLPSTQATDASHWRPNLFQERKKNPAKGRIFLVERFQESVLVSTPEVGSALLTSIN